MSALPNWNATDDSAQIPVKQAATRPDVHATHARQPVQLNANQQATAMRLSAFAGIAAVMLLGASVYFGMDTLQGDILGTETTVTITAAGEFSPREMTIAPGETLTLKNEHKDPQVLKPVADELFPVKVLFANESYSFTVPAGTKGDFHYMSEVLPAEQVLTIHVGEKKTVEQQAEVDIPLPEAVATHSAAPVAEEMAAESSSSAPAVTAVEGSIEDGTLTFSVKPAAGDIETAEAGEIVPLQEQGKPVPPINPPGQPVVPVNPYTVDSNEVPQIPSQVQQPIQINKPRTNAATGPGIWLSVSLAVVGIGLFYRREMRVR